MTYLEHVDAEPGCGGCGHPDCGCHDQGDTPDVDELHQIDVDPDVGLVVPVAVAGPANVHQLPLELGECKSELLDLGAAARRVLGRNNRRGVVTLWADPDAAAFDDIQIGGTQAEAQSSTAAVIYCTGTVPVRFDFHFRSELWARTRIGATNPGLLNIVTQDWSR